MKKWWLPLVLIGILPWGIYGLDFAEASHLVARTGFGTPSEMVFRLAGLTRVQAVDLLLEHLGSGPALAPPVWGGPPFLRPPGDKDHPADAAARQEYDKQKEARKSDLRAWFIDDAVKAEWPLNQKINLFWHNHFTSSLEKLDSGEFLLQQDLTLRRLGSGGFGDLVKAVAQDPAMVLYLDGDSNRKGKPNENFARELMELFTLGEGHYSESDVKEAARAFTGWTVDRTKGIASFNPKLHDDGSKTFLGATGAFRGDDIIDIILAQPRTSVFITEELWREFVSLQPDPIKIAQYAEVYRQSDYQLKVVLRLLLLDDTFWNPQNRNSLVKSPVELLVGQIRTLGMTGYDTKRLTGQLARLGQDLFNPLSVKGWPEGLDWIDAATLLERRRDLADLNGLFRKQWQSAESNLE